MLNWDVSCLELSMGMSLTLLHLSLPHPAVTGSNMQREESYGMLTGERLLETLVFLSHQANQFPLTELLGNFWCL